MTRIVLSGATAYIRTPWNNSHDLVQKVLLRSDDEFGNNAFNLKGAALAAKNIPDYATVSAFSQGTLLTWQGDDVTPILYNGTYSGGNHGPFFVHNIKSAGHGKTVHDIGSEWAALGRKWYILRIVDADTIWVISENTGTGQLWSFDLRSLQGETLQHSSSALHTSSITVASDTTEQLRPALQNQVKSIRPNGGAAVTTDGVYYANYIDIENSYDIANPVSLINHLRARAGSPVQPSYIDPSITADFRVSATYRFSENGACAVSQRIEAVNSNRFGHALFVMANSPIYAGKSLMQYIPKVRPVTGMLKTWNFKTMEDITSQVETINTPISTWIDSSSPPDRMAQIVRNGSANEFGVVIGYSPLRGACKSTVRAGAVDNAIGLSAYRKQYPKVVTGSAFPGGIMPAGTVIEGVGYRALFNSELLPQATVFTWYYDGDDIVVVLDFHQSVTNLSIPLPVWMSGRSATVIDAESLVLQTPVVSKTGLVVSVTGGYGRAMILLRKAI